MPFILLFGSGIVCLFMGLIGPGIALVLISFIFSAF